MGLFDRKRDRQEFAPFETEVEDVASEPVQAETCTKVDDATMSTYTGAVADARSAMWRDDWEDRAQDGSEGLCALLWGHNATLSRHASALAGVVLDAGWEGVHDREALTQMLYGHDLRDWATASHVANLIERLGWERPVIKPDAMLWDGNTEQVTEWLGRETPPPGAAVGAMGIKAEESITGRFVAVFPGNVIRRVGDRFEVLSPQHPESSLAEADHIDEPVPYLLNEEGPTEDDVAYRDSKPSDPRQTWAILADLYEEVARLMVPPTSHCQYEYNGGLKNALDIIAHAVRAFGGNVEEKALPEEEREEGPTVTLADQFGLARVDPSSPQGKALLASLAEFLPGLADFLTRGPEQGEGEETVTDDPR